MNKEGWLKVGVVGVPICAYSPQSLNLHRPSVTGQQE